MFIKSLRYASNWKQFLISVTNYMVVYRWCQYDMKTVNKVIKKCCNVFQIKGMVLLVLMEVIRYITTLVFSSEWWADLHGIWEKFFSECNCEISNYSTHKFGFNVQKYLTQQRKLNSQVVFVDSVVHDKSPRESLQLYKKHRRKIKYPLL